MAFKPKTLYLIRHAESQYNAYMHSPLNWLTFRCCFDPRIYDPVLSAIGELQAKRLHEKLIKENIMPKIDLVVSSPLTRSIQTAVFAFPPSSSTSTSSTLSSPTKSEGVSPKLQPLLFSTARPETPESIVMDEGKRSSSSYSTFSSDSKETSKEKKINIEEESERKDKDEDTKKNEKKN